MEGMKRSVGARSLRDWPVCRRGSALSGQDEDQVDPRPPDTGQFARDTPTTPNGWSPTGYRRSRQVKSKILCHKLLPTSRRRVRRKSGIPPASAPAHVRSSGPSAPSAGRSPPPCNTRWWERPLSQQARGSRGAAGRDCCTYGGRLAADRASCCNSRGSHPAVLQTRGLRPAVHGDERLYRFRPLQGVAAWLQGMGTDQVQKTCLLRAAVADCINAPARNRGLPQLPVRGLRKAEAVTPGHALAHNR